MLNVHLAKQINDIMATARFELKTCATGPPQAQLEGDIASSASDEMSKCASTFARDMRRYAVSRASLIRILHD
jgi:hypothetical protein